MQTADLEPQTKSQPAGRVGKKRLRVEALLAAAASPVPPPLEDLMPDPLLQDELPEDLAWLLHLLPRADLYLQDEVEIALHPTLTRVWCPKGRRGQRLVETPGNNEKQYGFGLVDWRDGWFDWERAAGRRAAPLCAQLRRAVARSQARGRLAMVLLDNLGIHTPKGSLLLRQLLDELRGQLILVYTPAYDPDANRIEWLWRALRRTSLMPTLAKRSACCWRMLMPGHTRSLPWKSSAKSAARSLTRPLCSLTRNSFMPRDRHSLPGSI
jgi:hypothetical protein